MAEENEIDLESPAIKAAIATAVEASVTGLKTKNTELLGKLKDTSNKLTQFETQFEGIDIDAVKGLLKGYIQLPACAYSVRADGAGG